MMSEIVEPQPGHHVCDWAAGSGGLLLQCRSYIERHHGKKACDRLFFYMQESNPSTANIARINMILHGVRSFQQAPASDSLRSPHFREGQTRRLRQFDRIVMNPPFSLDSWGYDDFIGGDPYDRFGFGMPPRDNGDYAWMQQVVKSLKPTGRAIVVMSQGILFRGQPEQTEAEDGRNQKADVEHVIRKGFVEADLIECVIVLPSKVFYGNSVPACLVILNKRKPPEREGKILLVWASRHFQNATPQNVLRRADCMRILVPVRAFGDLDRCRVAIPEYERVLLSEIEQELEAGLREIDQVYGPFLEQVPSLEAEHAEREAALREPPPAGKAAKKQFSEKKKANVQRIKNIKLELKTLEKLTAEAEAKRTAARQGAERETLLVRETAADLNRICTEAAEAGRYFVVSDRSELEQNEFNLNLPRYIDTFEPDETVDTASALARLGQAALDSQGALAKLQSLLKPNGAS